MRLPSTRGRMRVLAALVVLVHAGVQAALVAVAPRQPLEPGALALAVVSGVALLVATAALWCIATGRLAWPLVGRVSVVALIVAATSVVAPVVVPVVVAAGCPVLAAGGVRPAGRLLRRRPWRVALLLVATAVVVVLGEVAAMLLGLLVTGAAASAITWVLVGTLGALLIRAWVLTARMRSVVAQP